jgi:hypothetical protein
MFTIGDKLTCNAVVVEYDQDPKSIEFKEETNIVNVTVENNDKIATFVAHWKEFLSPFSIHLTITNLKDSSLFTELNLVHVCFCGVDGELELAILKSVDSIELLSDDIFTLLIASFCDSLVKVFGQRFSCDQDAFVSIFENIKPNTNIKHLKCNNYIPHLFTFLLPCLETIECNTVIFIDPRVEDLVFSKMADAFKTAITPSKTNDNELTREAIHHMFEILLKNQKPIPSTVTSISCDNMTMKEMEALYALGVRKFTSKFFTFLIDYSQLTYLDLVLMGVDGTVYYGKQHRLLYK